MKPSDDPITLELFKNAIFSLADEMALTIMRTSYSGILKDNMDYSTALCDAEGLLVAQGLTIPIHLGSVPTALASVMRRFRGDIHPGDVFILNDPFDGGMHLPDIFIFQPIFAGGERIAFAATICHHTDVGGRVPGSNAADSTEIYQEGLRIPALKLYERGCPRTPIFKIIEKNVRVPVRVLGDLRAQLAACYTAEKGFSEIVERHGIAATRRLLAAVLDYSERLARAGIRGLPDGIYDFEDWVDDDGVEVGKPIRLKVTIHKDGDRLSADWTGSSPQVKGALNSTLSVTKAALYCAVKSILPSDVPPNEGFFRTIEVSAPEGTVVNPLAPAATAARGLTAFRKLDCCFGALAKMCPERVFAASDGGNVGVAIGGYRAADREPFIYVDFISSAWGARPWADGLEGNTNLFTNISALSVEMAEVENPVQVLAYEYVQDGMGVGRFRGGAPHRRDYRFLESEAVLQIRSDRRTFRPYGLFGGGPGQPSVNILNPGRSHEILPSKVTRTIRRGDLIRYETAGGGGWGDPLEREPASVLRDVRNAFISLEAARERYGVIIDGMRATVDAAGTRKLRSRLRERRGWTEPPIVDRGSLPDGVTPE